MEAVTGYVHSLAAKYDAIWTLRDTRMDSFPLMFSPFPTLAICLSYVYIVKIWGPAYMKDRKPMEIRGFLIAYNAFQVALSAYIFAELVLSGWGTGNYSWRCQPVDYSNDANALRMARACYFYYFSKFTEFVDTFCFVARKKFNHITLLHVVHHGIMPLSVWPGARFVPGGHSSFFGLLNTFVHIFMYTYYLLAALGPKYQKFIWWKQHMTSLQMVQFIGIMVHGSQLLWTTPCGFPWQYGLFIAAHAVMFFFLFGKFYMKEYFTLGRAKKIKIESNGHAAAATNGHSNGFQNGIGSKTNGVTAVKRSAIRKEL